MYAHPSPTSLYTTSTPPDATATLNRNPTDDDAGEFVVGHGFNQVLLRSAEHREQLQREQVLANDDGRIRRPAAPLEERPARAVVAAAPDGR